MTLYKWLTPEHRGIYGHGDYARFVPNGKPGKWLPRIANPKLCERGYHIVTLAGLSEHLVAGHAVLYEVEARGASADGGDKTAWEQIRFVSRVGATDQALSVVFACECAERVLPIFERERPGDERPRRAIEAARAWAAANPCEKTAAGRDAARDAATAAARDAATAAGRAAAWAAARDAATAAARDAATAAAWAAARDAARAAAWAAARDAAWAAATAAAGAAEQEWQGERLLALVREAAL